MNNIRRLSVTGSAEFKAWFGNSKVVNSEGKPLMVYRGDRPNKTKFTGREDPTNYIQGNIIFSDSPDVAKFYTAYRTKYMVRPEQLGENEGLYRAFLSMQNPLVVDAKGEDWMSVPWKGGRIQIDDLAVKVKRLGHDGLIVKNVMDQGGDGTQYVVFKPEQVLLRAQKYE